MVEYRLNPAIVVIVYDHCNKLLTKAIRAGEYITY